MGRIDRKEWVKLALCLSLMALLACAPMQAPQPSANGTASCDAYDQPFRSKPAVTASTI